ncbi:uncharacterized protein METZ01_LOCUS123324 [marine metagenome]|uniref:Uncharacterized protein n=1 Tax=marine metagenome TaxID=408172 RepID=A0A381Y0R7_9ZZZZ
MISEITGSLTRVHKIHSRTKGPSITPNAHAYVRVVATGVIAALAVTGNVAAQITAEGGGATISLGLEHVWSLLWFGVALYALSLAQRGLQSNFRIEDAIEGEASDEDKRASTALGAIELTSDLKEALNKVTRAGAECDEAKEIYKRRSEKLESRDELNFDARLQHTLSEVVNEAIGPLTEKLTSLTVQTEKNTTALAERDDTTGSEFADAWNI